MIAKTFLIQPQYSTPTISLVVSISTFVFINISFTIFETFFPFVAKVKPIGISFNISLAKVGPAKTP